MIDMANKLYKIESIEIDGTKCEVMRAKPSLRIYSTDGKTFDFSDLGATLVKHQGELGDTATITIRLAHENYVTPKTAAVKASPIR